jgi:2',3'-cyclic-nucleotide 2'-phosphodiesterase (5'-nucleotidase family)
MRSTKRVVFIVAFLALALALVFGAAQAAPRQTMTLQVLSVSDWHAQLDPLSVSGIGNVGGAAYLSTYFQAERAANPHTLLFTAGDAYGASPPLSNFFDEVPAVLAMRMMGFDADGFGNHNFDRGIAHLQQMIDLAAAPAGQEPGQPFPYVSANLGNREENLSGVQDYVILTVGGLKVAVIGVLNPEAPELVFPGNFGTIVPTDPVAAVNKARAAARQEGAKFFIVLAHMGVTHIDQATGMAAGPLIDFANNVGGIDLILGDHTDFEYTGIHNNALVIENRSKARTYARATFEVDPQNGRVLSREMAFITPLSAAVTPDPAIVAMLDEFRAELGPIFNTVIGQSTVFIPRADSCGRPDGRLCESLVGNLTTDALRTTYSMEFAITNSGGLRESLTCPTTDVATDFCPPYTPPPFPITRGQVLAVLPFGNIVVTASVSGDILKAFLENGVSAMPGANGRFPQVSGLCFTYDVAAAPGSRVLSAVRQAADGSCTGAPIDFSAGAVYSLATNDFMATGGDGYPVIYPIAVTQGIMDQVLADYIAANTPLTPTIQGRIVCTTSNPAVLCPTILP